MNVDSDFACGLRRGFASIQNQIDEGAFHFLRIEHAHHVSGEVMGMFDPQKVERAFINLVLNACEASAQTAGEIAVNIHSSADEFEIRVADHGPGVPAAIRNTLFDPFVSCGKSNGTGLGLAIVNKVIGDHGGSVTVESTSPAGTTFLVKLPRSVHLLNEAAQPVAG